MSNSSTNDEDAKQQTITNPHSACSELLTKIYYPETLYPDNYRFFADRESSSVRSSLIDADDQQPTTHSTRPSTEPVIVPSQTTIEIKTLERQSKHRVSVLFALKTKCIFQQASMLFYTITPAAK